MFSDRLVLFTSHKRYKQHPLSVKLKLTLDLSLHRNSLCCSWTMWPTSGSTSSASLSSTALTRSLKISFSVLTARGRRTVTTPLSPARRYLVTFWFHVSTLDAKISFNIYIIKRIWNKILYLWLYGTLSQVNVLFFTLTTALHIPLAFSYEELTGSIFQQFYESPEVLSTRLQSVFRSTVTLMSGHVTQLLWIWNLTKRCPKFGLVLFIIYRTECTKALTDSLNHC